jgi:uncharacterized membrane protein YccC
MFWWIVGVAFFVLVWGMLWKRNLELALGILLGLPVAWLFSKFLAPYVTGMEEVPLWLPPLPLAIVAVLLFTKGALVWIRGNDALPKVSDEHEHQH